jgi:EmrB/QacA subfamily drug resistance transporter
MSSKQQKLVLWVSILASLVAFLDIAVVNVALPAIQKSLGGGLSTQQWVVDAYLITLGSLILIAGSLSDLLGRKKVLFYGLLGFAVTSLMCAVAPNAGFLVGSRALQGIAGALLVPSSLALIISTFSGPAQGKAIGTWTAWTGIAFLVGPLLGGFLIDHGSWRWVFAINVIPIAITLWLLRQVTVPDVRKNIPIDIMGAVLCALGLGGPVYALIEQPHYGWGSPLIYLPLILGLAIFVSFIWYESVAKYPMLPLKLFKRRNFSVGNLATTSIYGGLSAATFLIIVFVQQVGGYSAFHAGLSLLPVTIIMFVLSPRFGALSAKYGPRWFMAFGPIIAGGGFLLMLGVTSNVNYWTQLFPAIIFFGLGLSLTVAPLTAAILGDVDPSNAGIASAVNNAIARVAGLLAVAAIGAVVAAQFSSALDNSLSQNLSGYAMTGAVDTVITEAKSKPLSISLPDNALAYKIPLEASLKSASESAFHTGVWVMSGLLILGGVISAVGIRNPKT